MKQYHTEILLNAPVKKVWQVLTDFDRYPEWNPLVGWLKGDFRTGGSIQMFIKPLNSDFSATLKRVEVNKEFTWVGVRFASWILSGEHYYRLEKCDDNSTRLQHGEYFRGIGSSFISQALLKKIEDTFVQHNLKLKDIVEN